MSPDKLRNQFHEQLEALELSAVTGLGLVLVELDRVLEALEKHDLDVARRVVKDDDHLKDRYLAFHQATVSLLALQAPVAGELRLITALLQITKGIERMTAQCVNIAKLIPLHGLDRPASGELLATLLRMGHAVRSEVQRAKTAFSERDTELAVELADGHLAVGRMDREIFRLAAAVDPGDLEWAMTMILVARALERIGNNAVDIGEQTTFVVTAQFRSPSP